MKYLKFVLCAVLLICFTTHAEAQCNQTMSINSFSAECNGNGTSTVTINVTITFGGGNNSVTISYNIGSGEVVAIIIEDDNGDIINQTYMFDVSTCDNYSVTLTAWTNPAGGGSSCTDPPPITTPIILPVTFGHLDIVQKGNTVLVEWSTYTETNNERFEIQRAKEYGDFTTIGGLEGAGNSLQKIYYEFLDEDIDSGTYYYRIKQIDLDGKFTFSVVESIKIHMTSRLAVYPNPAKDYISINSQIGLTYRIVDSYGNLIQSNKMVGEDAKIDISQLNDGMYYLLSSGGTEMVSFIKI